MVKKTVTINTNKQSEVAVAAKGVTATCSESAAKNPDGRGLIAKFLHRRAAKTQTPTTKVRLHNPFSLAGKDHSQRKHFRDWFRRKTSSSHVDGQKHWCSLGFNVSSLRKVFSKPDNCIALSDEDSSVTAVAEKAVATVQLPDEVGDNVTCFEIQNTLDHSVSFTDPYPGEISEQVRDSAEVVTVVQLYDEFVDNAACYKTLDFLTDHSMLSFNDDHYVSDLCSPYGEATVVASVEVTVETLSTIKENQETVTSASEEVDYDSFSTIDLGEYNPTELLPVGPKGYGIFSGLRQGNPCQENSAVPLHVTETACPSYGLSVVTNTVCNVLGSIGERASKMVQQQLAAEYSKRETGSQMLRKLLSELN
ncbi:hypothetical protein V1525DRAFT_337990 [Lipomyces kononenkoae]|uniref:Uncharacterized protein n=1 Tax=Lipomyces kononenkoae TaxID=34357 RepID=A0ACC3T829_LIPKO